jgi:hypothetical protein
MSNIITKFDSFINEELSPETYVNAANKLDKLDHPNRAKELLKHAEKNMNIESFKLKSFAVLGGNKEENEIKFLSIKPILKSKNFYFLVDVKCNDEIYNDNSLIFNKESGEAEIVDNKDRTLDPILMIFINRKEALKFIRYIKNIIKNDTKLKDNEKELIFKNYMNFGINALYSELGDDRKEK